VKTNIYICIRKCLCLSGRVFGKGRGSKDTQATGSISQRPWPRFLLDGRKDFDCARDCDSNCDYGADE